MLANDKLKMDLGHFKLEFINGRWKEQGVPCTRRVCLPDPPLKIRASDQKHSTAQTVEDENRELHGKIRTLNSENNMLKYRNEVLMQMVSADPRTISHPTFRPAMTLLPLFRS